MKLVNCIGIVVAAVAATAIASARAEASSFSVNFCPGGSGCPAGVTEASLSFDEIVATSDVNDYLLTTKFKGDATETAKLDAWSFSIDSVQTPSGYENLPVLGATFPASGSPWVVSFDNINANDCNGSGGAQEVCFESTGNAGVVLTSSTLTFTAVVNLADGLNPFQLSSTSQINLRARFQPNGNLSPGSQLVTVGPGNGGVEQQIAPTAVPEPASLALLGSGLLAMASRVRKRLKNRS